MYSTLWRMKFTTEEEEQTDATDEKVKDIKVGEENANIYIIYIPSGMTRSNKAK